MIGLLCYKCDPVAWLCHSKICYMGSGGPMFLKRKRIIRPTMLFLMCLLIIPAVSLGEQISIPLPDLTGWYVANGNGSKIINLNCGIQFTDIQSVQIACEGYYIPGTFRNVTTGEIVPINGTFCFEMPAFPGTWMACLPDDGTGMMLEHEYFTTLFPSTTTWDFLLDGQADITGFLSYNVIAIYSVITHPSGQISDAYLLIDGTLNPIDAIELLKPNTRQYLIAGSTYRIEWNDWRYYGSCSGDFVISYSLDNGQNWIHITASPISNTCFYDWQVPAITAENCLVKVEENNTSLMDISDVSFAVYECSSPPSGDFTGDCYINFRDFQVISASCLETGGYTMDDLESLAQNWLGCLNPFNPDCGL